MLKVSIMISPTLFIQVRMSMKNEGNHNIVSDLTDLLDGGSERDHKNLVWHTPQLMPQKSPALPNHNSHHIGLRYGGY